MGKGKKRSHLASKSSILSAGAEKMHGIEMMHQILEDIIRTKIGFGTLDLAYFHKDESGLLKQKSYLETFGEVQQIEFDVLDALKYYKEGTKVDYYPEGIVKQPWKIIYYFRIKKEKHDFNHQESYN